jgi:hypothetical protein
MTNVHRNAPRLDSEATFFLSDAARLPVQKPALRQLEPTRSTVCAIVAPRRAAHLQSLGRSASVPYAPCSIRNTASVSWRDIDTPMTGA